MEDQIASLAGLVHHALSMGPDIPGVKEAVRSVTSDPTFVPLTTAAYTEAAIQVNTPSMFIRFIHNMCTQRW